MNAGKADSLSDSACAEDGDRESFGAALRNLPFASTSVFVFVFLEPLHRQLLLSFYVHLDSETTSYEITPHKTEQKSRKYLSHIHSDVTNKKKDHPTKNPFKKTRAKKEQYD